MSHFELVEEFQRFLEHLEREDPDFLRREIHYLGTNCSSQGLDAHVPLFPLFLDEELSGRYRRFGQNVQRMLECVMDVLVTPGHPMGGLVRSFLTVPEAVERLLATRPPGGIVPRVVRPDTVIHGDRIIAHEINVSWPGGTSDADIIIDTLHENTLYRAFREHLAERGVELVSPSPRKSIDLLLEQVLEAADVEHPYIAIVMPTPDVVGFGGDAITLTNMIRDRFREHGYDADVMNPHHVSYDRRAHVDGRPVDVMYRVFEWGHVTGSHSEDYGPILQAYADGVLPLVNSFHSEALSAKSIFELLHCQWLWPIFDGFDLEELLECIPYTVNLVNLPSIEPLLAEPERWVLKAIKGSCADGVILGIEAQEEVWRRTIDYGLESGNVVMQEYVDAPLMLMSMFPEHELEQVPRYVDIDPLLYGGEMGNFFARFSALRITSAVGVGGGMFAVVPVTG